MKLIINNSKVVFAKYTQQHLGQVTNWNSSASKLSVYFNTAKDYFSPSKNVECLLSCNDASTNELLAGKTITIGFYTTAGVTRAEYEFVYGEKVSIVVPDSPSSWDNFIVMCNNVPVGTKQFYLDIWG